MKKLILCFLMMSILISCQQSRQEKLRKEALQTNIMCPISIDKETTLDSMTYQKSDNTLYYYYSLTGSLDNPQKINNLKYQITKNQLETVKNSVELRKYKEWGISFCYIYFSKTSHKLLLNMKFAKEQYNN